MNIKRRIRAWLGLKDKDYYHPLVVKRIGGMHPDEAAFQEDLAKLAQKYPSVPMLFIQNMQLEFGTTEKQTMLLLPDEISLHGLIQRCVFNGSIAT